VTVALAPGESTWFESLEFNTDSFSNLSLYPEGNELGAIFVGLVHSGPSSMHTIQEESSNEGNTAFGGVGNSGLPSPRGCNMVTLIAPITTGLLRKQQQAY
jgi:hypothetical protein